MNGLVHENCGGRFHVQDGALRCSDCGAHLELRRPLQWTRERPTKPGWWWAHAIDRRADSAQPVKVEPDLSVWFRNDSILMPWESAEFEWAGPIEPPPLPPPLTP